MKETNPIEESRRYVKNAKQILKENADLDIVESRYQDDKYVRAAGSYLWSGVLIALDAVFHVKKDPFDRVDITDYRTAIAKRDRKLLGMVNDGYEYIHLYMSYDGTLSKKTCDEGFHLANAIIDRCALMLDQTPVPAV